MAVRVIDIIFRTSVYSALRGFGQVSHAADATAASIDRGAGKMRTAGTAMSGLGRVMTGVAAGLGAVGYVSAKHAIEFQQAMTQIQATAGASAGEVADMSRRMLELSKSQQVAFNPTDLAKGLYHIESLGLRGSQAYKALKIAADAAAVGNTDLETTATAVGSAMIVGMKGTGSLSHMVGILNATVGAGNMKWQDLNHALSMQILPAAKNAGLSLANTGAAIATLADVTGNAGSSSAQLATALHFLTNPTAKAGKALAYIHMNTVQMAQDMQGPQGLLGALKDLKGHMKGLDSVTQEQILGAILPGGRGRIMLTLINNLDRYQKKLDQIEGRSNTFGTSVAATHRTAAFKIKAAYASIQGSLTEFGATLLPILAKILPKFVSLLSKVFHWLTHLPKGVKKFLVELTLFLAIGGPVLMLFGAMASAIGAIIALLGVLTVTWAGLAIATGIGLVIAAVIFLGMHLKEVKKIVRQVGDAFVSVFKEIKKIFSYAIENTPLGIGLKMLATAAHVGNDLIHGHFGKAGKALVHGASSILHSATFGLIGGAHGGIVTPHGIKRFQFGGPVGMDTVPAMLSPGEGVLTRAAMTNIGIGGLAALNAGGSMAPIVITPTPAYFMIDGRMIARAMINFTTRAAARGPSTISGGSLAVPMTTIP